MRTVLILGVALLTLFISGCASRAAVGYGEPHYHSGGPPPHAPAHGYRAKHHHHDMVYDSRLGAYVVVGYDDYYFHDDLYFRYRSGGWQFNINLDDRDWRHADDRQVPKGLKRKYKGSGKGKDKDKDKYRGRY
ncbi:hypothetical protein [Methylophaga sp. OBS4]|uniref:hypothetical protein n=1 Tax=Methylophaga sp. OBS4 TaxID=2991935 RepID=UPI00225198CB|nr:hypothetical protein [Methylophaga sp. OBS4]MCX4188487.1 hypothetical protein [Methylophaga sp. OBS4]